MVQCLSRATTATFEELALLFPDQELTPDQAAAPLDVAVSVEFRGPVIGRLIVRISSTLLPTIAANMLGEQGARQAPLQRDAFGEIANVICGNVLPAICGAEAVFHLQAPYLSAAGGDVSARPADEPQARVEIGLEQGRAEVSLFHFAPRVASDEQAVPSLKATAA